MHGSLFPYTQNKKNKSNILKDQCTNIISTPSFLFLKTLSLLLFYVRREEQLCICRYADANEMKSRVRDTNREDEEHNIDLGVHPRTMGYVSVKLPQSAWFSTKSQQVLQVVFQTDFESQCLIDNLFFFLSLSNISFCFSPNLTLSLIFFLHERSTMGFKLMKLFLCLQSQGFNSVIHTSFFLFPTTVYHLFTWSIYIYILSLK